MDNRITIMPDCEEFESLVDKIALSLVCRTTRTIFTEVFTVEALTPIFHSILSSVQRDCSVNLRIYRMAFINERYRTCIKSYLRRNHDMTALLSEKITISCAGKHWSFLDQMPNYSIINRYIPIDMKTDAYISMHIFALSSSLWDTLRPKHIENVSMFRLNEVFVFLEEEMNNTDRIDIDLLDSCERVNLCQLRPFTLGYGSLEHKLYIISGDYQKEWSKLINTSNDEMEVQKKIRILLRKYSRVLSDEIEARDQYIKIMNKICSEDEYARNRVKLLINKANTTSALWKDFNFT